MSEADDAREVLHTVWAAQGQGADDIDSVGDRDDDCSPTKVCKNMKDVTFDGYAEPGSDLRQAWRDKLAREGKLNTEGGSIRDIVLGPQSRPE